MAEYSPRLAFRCPRIPKAHRSGLDSSSHPGRGCFLQSFLTAIRILFWSLSGVIPITTGRIIFCGSWLAARHASSRFCRAILRLKPRSKFPFFRLERRPKSVSAWFAKCHCLRGVPCAYESRSISSRMNFTRNATTLGRSSIDDRSLNAEFSADTLSIVKTFCAASLGGFFFVFACLPAASPLSNVARLIPLSACKARTATT